MFDPTKPVQTRDGRPAKIVSTNGPGRFPVMAVVTNPNGVDYFAHVTTGGCATDYPGAHPGDLVNVPQETAEFYNVYLKGFFPGGDVLQLSGKHETYAAAYAAFTNQDAVDSFVMKVTRRNGRISDAKLIIVDTRPDWEDADA